MKILNPCLVYMPRIEPYRSTWRKAIDEACRDGILSEARVQELLFARARQGSYNLGRAEVEKLIEAMVNAGDLLALGCGLYSPTDQARQYGADVREAIM